MSEDMKRVPPHNIEAEQSVLGSMLVDVMAVNAALEKLQPQDFYRDSHRAIFTAMVDLTEKNKPIDLITVADNLKKMQLVEKAGGLSYVSSLSDVVPTTANISQYCNIVVEKAILRRLILTSSEIIGDSYGAEDVGAILDDAERRIFEISQKRAGTSYAHIREVAQETFTQIEHMYNHRGNVTGLPTGFLELDKLISGLQKSDLVILAGRPSMGKTACALNMVQNIALRSKKGSVFFSLEMSRHQLAQRMICSEAGVDSQRVRTGYLEEEDWGQLALAVAQLSSANIFIDDTPGIPILELRSKARRLKAEHDIDLIVVDYLQLVTTSRRVESRQQEIAYITRQLKSLARELEVPVVALAQLSRAVEQRQDKRPNLSDLRESGEIEQTADVVGFLYREDYYNPEAEDKNMIDIIVAKHRNGPTGHAKLLFFKNIGKFANLDNRYGEASG